MRDNRRIAVIVSVGALLIFFASALPGQEIAPCRAFLSNGSAFDAVRCIAIPVTPPVDTIVTPPIDTIITPPADSVPWSFAMHMAATWVPLSPGDCPAATHVSYSAVGPDGKLYPIWHPPVDTIMGVQCVFRHEHGDDPRTSSLYARWGEIFFGFANEQRAIQEGVMPRHEDHVGHKVKVQEDMVFTAQGVGAPITCSILTKLHQGTHSADGFTNNLHEQYDRRACSDGSYHNVVMLSQIGPAGQLQEQCTGTRIEVGPAVPEDSPRTPNPFNGSRSMGNRFLPTRGCTDKARPNDHENWKTQNTINCIGDTGFCLRFANYWNVSDPSRAYWPASPGKMRRTIDNCWDVIAGKFKVISNPCVNMRRDAAGVPIPWDDERSPFKGVQRSVRFDGFLIRNRSGVTVWYTDALGKNASATPFPGSIRQEVSGIQLAAQYVGTATGRNYNAPGVRAPN